MSAPWESYPDAPEPGTRLCAVEDVPAARTRSVTVGGFSVLIVRGALGLRAFVNACPHQFLPLDYRATDVLSGDGHKLICSNHDAVFDAETGEGLGGFANGCHLDVVPIMIEDGAIVIAAAQRSEERDGG